MLVITAQHRPGFLEFFSIERRDHFGIGDSEPESRTTIYCMFHLLEMANDPVLHLPLRFGLSRYVYRCAATAKNEQQRQCDSILIVRHNNRPSVGFAQGTANGIRQNREQVKCSDR